jgi:hypothetical protein
VHTSFAQFVVEASAGFTAPAWKRCDEHCTATAADIERVTAVKGNTSNLDFSCEAEIVQPAAAMDEQSDNEIAGKKQRDQMLKLVSKGFYNELINYGMRRNKVLRVASHLLDNLLAQEKNPPKAWSITTECLRWHR